MNNISPLRILGAALATAAFFLPTAHAQNATTVPVGFVSVQLDANRKTAISIPLEKSPVAFGTVSAVTSNSITDSSANFGAYANSHYVRIKTGNAAGRNLPIKANTTTQITLETGVGQWYLPVDNSSGNTVDVSVGDKFEILPLWTLGEIFGATGAECVLKTATNPNQADQVSTYINGVQYTFFHNGTNFRNAINSLDTTNYNSFGILPTGGLWVLRRSSGTNSFLDFTGTVANIAPRYHLPGGVSFAQGIPVAAKATLASLNFSSLSTWNKSNNPNNADQVTVYQPNGTSWVLFVNTAGVWRNALNSGDATDYTNVELQSGSGLWIRKRGASNGSAVNAASNLPYNIN